MSSHLLSSFISSGVKCPRCRLVGISAAFHTSSVSAATLKTKRLPTKRAKGRTKGSSKTQFKTTSRTRLAKDLKPEGRDGKYEVAKAHLRTKPNRTEFRSSKAAQADQKASIEALLNEEFDRSTAKANEQLPESFSSPPLTPALLQSITDVLGPDARPTPIQGLALKHLSSLLKDSKDWKQFLLASETGSGKSFAYLLPLLQYLKESEEGMVNSTSRLRINPRALILAPTHELSRQLSVFAKSLVHYAKLRVLCASRANVPHVPDKRVGGASSARQMKQLIQSFDQDQDHQRDIESARPIDALVGTPVKALEMVRGWGWDKVGKEESERDGRKFKPGKSEMGLKRVECVVVDEADVLFDPDFRETTLNLLSDISAARGQPISPNSESQPINYPFHLIVTSATIPASLSSYLSAHHPQLTRLVSPRLHHLPPTLQTEYVGWTGGNRFADIEKRLQRVWTEDALRGPDRTTGRVERSRVLIFCNRSTTVNALGEHLTARGIANVTLTSTAPSRAHGSNKHLSGFLKPSAASASGRATHAEEISPRDVADSPYVLITTSLLSRGLDFSPAVKHVFIVDSPRNMVDFLHRAGRSGRAGHVGKVVIFGKLKGRGSGVDVELKNKVKALGERSSGVAS